MLLSTKFPLVSRFQLIEQQKIVWNWEYAKEWTCGSADLYSGFGEG
jgi:hypothetical protein